MRRFVAPRNVAITLAVVVLVLIIATTGSDRPSIAAYGAMRDLQPKMQALDIARATCAPSGSERTCSTEELLATDAGHAVKLRSGSACIAPRAACVRVEGDLLIAELVSRELPGIGGIRLEGRAHSTETIMRWTCHPVRGSSDPAVVRRACGDVPLG